MTAPLKSAPFKSMLSTRYLRARRKEGFASVIAEFSFLGIVAGRRDPHDRDGGHERFPQGSSGQEPWLNGHVLVQSLESPLN